jgi:asparagine synthetase B (glutamine-hydrolysing)
MCGIAGGSAVRPEDMEAALAAIRHRGPARLVRRLDTEAEPGI